jgi:putative zinc finger/helix-turn-helix YgiT family protein
MNPYHTSSQSSNTPPSGVKRPCPTCNHTDLETQEVTTTFPYVDGDKEIDLAVTLPVHTCRACGFEFTDDEAERRRHEAVCKYRDVLPPAEIRAIRGHLTRQAFSKITGLGEATLGRWERGELIQTDANDRLLYLLTFSENIDRLRGRSESPSKTEQHRASPLPSLRAIPNPSLRLLQEAVEFVL